MANSVITSLNGSVQVADGTTNVTIFQRALSQLWSSTAGCIQGELVAVTGNLGLPAATGAVFLYIKNLSTSAQLTVNLTFGTGSAQACIIEPLGVLLFANNINSPSTALITVINFPSASNIEYVVAC